MNYHIWVDHYAYEVLPWITWWLDSQWVTYQCYWSSSNEDKSSITVFIPEVCEMVRNNSWTCWILVCGTGVGVDMWANKFQWIRAVFAATPEVAVRWKEYDNANLLCLSSWLSDKSSVITCLEAFHTSSFKDPTWRRAQRMAEMDSWR
jgi:RpiB/LacA/LacB family sugar-phosphate isomerase